MNNMRCTVFGCNEDTQRRPFHRFPKEPYVRAKWIHAISSRYGSFTLKVNSVVCSRHFLPIDYFEGSMNSVDVPLARAKLKPGAFPSVFLDVPHDGTEPLWKKVKTYGSTKMRTTAPGILETMLKSEFISSGKPDSINAGSSTDEAFQIPTEEIMIKPDPEESDDLIDEPLGIENNDEKEEDEEEVITIDDDDEEEPPGRQAEPIGSWRFVSDIDVETNNLLFRDPSEIKQEPIKRATPPASMPIHSVEQYPGHAIVVKTNPVKTIRRAKRKEFVFRQVTNKKHLADFSIQDMVNPHLAAKFYGMALSMIKRNDLLAENRNLQIKNKMLEDQIEFLKEAIPEFKLCPNCKWSVENARYKGIRAAKEGSPESQKRKAEDEDGPDEKPSKAPATVQDPSSPAVTNLAKEAPEIGLKGKKLKFLGTYRIVELEYFIKTFINMQHNHFLKHDGKHKLLPISETLVGISGHWTFACATCKFTRTLSTDRRAKSAKIGGPNSWLKWLQRFGPWSYVQETFENLGVPFHYSLTPSDLDVIEFKRQIANVDQIRVGKPVSNEVEVSDEVSDETSLVLI